MTASPAEHWGAFIFVFVASGIIYFNFSWFREQLCLVICPYGRLQSALIDDDSVVIGYDEKRGEPRGPASKEGFGDCIDCYRCVQVCPTGIDIRQGLQIECIGCANCIDACDAIMQKLDRPKGLVRYDSLNGLAGRTRRILRPRIVLYAALMLVGALAMTLSALQLRAANMNVVRMTGAPYFVDQDTVRNQYMVRIINKGDSDRTYRLDVEAPGESVAIRGTEDGITVAPMEEAVRPVVVSQSLQTYGGAFPVHIRLLSPEGEALIDREAEFIGPNPELLPR